MKGIVFNLLEEVVTEAYGADAWDSLLDAAGLDGAYTSLGSYADEEVVRLVTVASETLKQPPDEILRWFGRRAIPLLAQRYPGFFAPHKDTRSFLLTLNHIIHAEVRKLYPGAATPVFDFDRSDAATWRIGYNSERKMCALAHGFMLGAADHFGETLDISHQEAECMHHGAAKCGFTVRFAS
jgi:hypothetical protein